MNNVHLTQPSVNSVLNQVRPETSFMDNFANAFSSWRSLKLKASSRAKSIGKIIHEACLWPDLVQDAVDWRLSEVHVVHLAAIRENNMTAIINVANQKYSYRLSVFNAMFGLDEIWGWEGVVQVEVPGMSQKWWLSHIGNPLHITREHSLTL